MAQRGATETLLFLKPVPLPDGTPRRPRKRIEVREDGSLAAAKGAFKVKTFSGELVKVSGIRTLHEVIRSRALVGEAVLVAGLPSASANVRRMQRTSVTIDDRESHIIVSDVDDLPNYRQLDPAVDPTGASESIRELMPPSIRCAALSAAFSSSTGLGDGVPATLSLHLRVWGTRGMGEAERTAIVRGLHNYAMARLTELGAEPTGRIDHALTRRTQMQSIAAPEMPDSHPDPFASSSRHVLLEGVDAVSLDALLEELVPFMAEEAPVAKQERRPKTLQGKPKGPLPCLTVTDVTGLRIPVLSETLPEDVRAALNAAMHFENVPRREGATRAQAARRAHAARSVLDLVRWAHARAAWGATVPVLAAWHRAGGVPEGLRDEFMVILHSRLGYALQGRGPGGSDFMGALAAVAVSCVGKSWFEEEWLGEGFHRSVTQRVGRSRAGERVEWAGGLRAPLYWHGKDTIRRTLGIGEAEAELLGLASLAERTTQVRMRRRANGARSADIVEDEAAALRLKARRLRGRGIGPAAVAAACGRSESWARAATAGIKSPGCGASGGLGTDAAINGKNSAEAVGTRGSRHDETRSRCVTSKGKLPLGRDGYSRPNGTYLTGSELGDGTLDSHWKGTPGDGPSTADDQRRRAGERDEPIVKMRRVQAGSTGMGAVTVPTEQTHPSGGPPDELEAPSSPARSINAPATAASWDALFSVPRGVMPRFGGWEWRGRAATRNGMPVWISGAGVVVRMCGEVDRGVPTWVTGGIAIARETALAPRKEVLRALHARERRDARATDADHRYREWLEAQGRGEADIVLPAEPDEMAVAGTSSWLADGRSRVIKALKRRDWRMGLEVLRRAEPLLVGAVISHLPTAEEERAACADGMTRAALRAERRRVAGKAERSVAQREVPRVPPGTVPATSPMAGRRFRTQLDATDIRAWAAAEAHAA